MSIRLSVVALCVVAMAACDDDDSGGDGETGGVHSATPGPGGQPPAGGAEDVDAAGQDAPPDSGATSDAAPPPPDAAPPPPDAAPVPPPEACERDGDCAEGACINLLSPYGLGAGYCGPSCLEDADCERGDGETWSCARVNGRRVCHRGCTSAAPCAGENEVCFLDWPVGGQDVVSSCVDATPNLCESDANCGETEYCGPYLGDTYRILFVCLTLRDSLGRVTSPRRVGAECNPASWADGPKGVACAGAEDCPEGWSCGPRADQRMFCQPPASEACADYCLPRGRCSGFCAEDAQCPEGMLCARTNYYMPTRQPDAFDDPLVLLRRCVAVEGSQTPCTREADCVATGSDGARELCQTVVRPDGGLRRICVRPIEGLGLPGDACGDDPETPAFDPSPCSTYCLFGQCGQACAEDGDCGPGWRCGRTSVETPESEDTVRFCVLDAPCEADSDCEAGVCHWTRLGGDDMTWCGPPNGALPSGSPCAPGDASQPSEARCATACLPDPTRTGEALTGKCTGPCSRDDQCLEGLQCSEISHTAFNGGTPDDRADDRVSRAGFCFDYPGSRAPCEVSGDCAEGEFCWWRWDPEGPERQCLTQVESGAAPGEACDPEHGCAGGGCMFDWYDPRVTYCTALCAGDNQCPEGLVCRLTEMPQPNTHINVCVTPEDPRGQPLE
jgi:hypothetical protein